jgi:non-specific serine/threonine protein kinase
MVTPGTKLGPYEIVALIGAGGMGEVYRARDERLGRDVAIKVLPAEFAADPERLRRFEQEARAVAALDHPNILAIHDVGTHEGSPYLVTELLEGESLRDRLRGGGLTVRKAVDIGVQIAQGLAAAHEKGVIHRDLKPGNVFVTKDGHVKILDFGIAKLLRPEGKADPYARTVDATPSTDSGAVLGTMGYISPEQLRGQAADARSDIFSFGCVLYEMLSGRSPFLKGTGAETVSAILNEDPRPLSGSGREIAPALQEIVNRCLEKRPEDRFDSAHDVALALRAFSGAGETPTTPPTGLSLGVGRWSRGRWLVVASIATLLIAVATAVWLWKGKPGAPGPDLGLKRIAVLPFENLGAPEDSYFADGMTDEVRGKLASLAGLAVIARSSSDQYRNTTKPPKQIADELSTPFLLTAKVRWQKSSGTSRIRVTPELVEVSGAGPPTTRWQDSFDADLQDIFRVQSEIATRVADALKVRFGSGEREQIAARPTTNLAAYDAYLRGEEIRRKSFQPPELRQAAAQFEQAVALDPGFALAWAALSSARTVEYFNGVPSRTLAESARQAAERAVQLAPDLAEARLAMSSYYNLVKQDSARAREECRAGLAANPRHAGLLTSMVHYDENLGHWENAVSQLELACSLDPRSAGPAGTLGQTFLWLRRYPEALAAFDHALALDTNLLRIQHKAMVFLAQGDLAGARVVVAAASKRVEPVAVIAFFAMNLGQSWVLDEAQQQILLRLTPASFNDDRAEWALALAETCALRGDMAQARRHAEEAHQVLVRILGDTPEAALLLIRNAEALAYLGRREEAIRQGERAAAVAPLIGSRSGRYVQWVRVNNYIILGDHEKALDLLEPLLRMPYFLTPGWLSIDPNFAPLRGNPRFEKLLKPKE